MAAFFVVGNRLFHTCNWAVWLIDSSHCWSTATPPAFSSSPIYLRQVNGAIVQKFPIKLNHQDGNGRVNATPFKLFARGSNG